MPVTSQFWIVDAAAVGAAPGNSVVPPRRCINPPHGEAAAVEIEEGQDAADAVAIEELGIDTEQPHGIAAAGRGRISLRIGRDPSAATPWR